MPEYGTPAYPDPIVDLGETRRQALEAYEAVKAGAGGSGRESAGD